MLPPHLPANRKVANGTKVRHGRRKPSHAGAAKARRIDLKGELRIGSGKGEPMIVRMRKEKARLC